MEPAKSFKTLVLGASTNEERYAYRAVKKLLAHGFEVVALGNRLGKIDSIEIQPAMAKIPFTDIHTVTLYLGPQNQIPYYDYILSLKPKRVIFNPGTENPELEKLLAENGIAFEESCTLVMLGTGIYDQ